MTRDFQKTNRDYHKSMNINEALKHKLNQAMNVMKMKDIETSGLRKLLQEYSENATQVKMEFKLSQIVQEQILAASTRMNRQQIIINEIRQAYKNSPMLQRIAQRQIQAIARWEERKKYLVEQAQRHLMSVLAASHLIDQTHFDGGYNPPSPKDSSIRITTFNRTPKSDSPDQSPGMSPHFNDQPLSPSNNPSSLKAGIIATPITTK